MHFCVKMIICSLWCKYLLQGDKDKENFQKLISEIKSSKKVQLLFNSFQMNGK